LNFIYDDVKLCARVSKEIPDFGLFRNQNTLSIIFFIDNIMPVIKTEIIDYIFPYGFSLADTINNATTYQDTEDFFKEKFTEYTFEDGYVGVDISDINDSPSMEYYAEYLEKEWKNGNYVSVKSLPDKVIDSSIIEKFFDDNSDSFYSHSRKEYDYFDGSEVWDNNEKTLTQSKKNKDGKYEDYPIAPSCFSDRGGYHTYLGVTFDTFKENVEFDITENDVYNLIFNKFSNLLDLIREEIEDKKNLDLIYISKIVDTFKQKIFNETSERVVCSSSLSKWFKQMKNAYKNFGENYENFQDIQVLG